MFDNYILGISKADFQAANDNHPESSLKSEVLPGNGNYELYSNLLKRVGEPWGWDRRPKYANDNEDLRARVALPTTHIHLFKKFNEILGYSLTVARPDLKSAFNNIYEVENFGFFLEHCGKGYGSYFLNDTFKYLFNHEADYIHLESRSTNHEKVLPFYIENGMKVINVIQNNPDDLLPA